MHAYKRYVANDRRLDTHAPFTAGYSLPYVVSCDGRYYALLGARSACKMDPRSLKHLPCFLGHARYRGAGTAFEYLHL